MPVPELERAMLLLSVFKKTREETKNKLLGND